MIGRIDEVVVDCADPTVLAQFWSAVLGGEPRERDSSWHYVLSSAAEPWAGGVNVRVDLGKRVLGR